MTNFFVQDDIQARPGLTLNLGLRYQYDTPPTEAEGRNVNFNFVTGELNPEGAQVFTSAKLNFAPRVGLAWTPFASRPSFVMRAGFGIFHVSFNPAEAQSLPENNINFGSSRLVTIFQDPTLVAFPEPDIQGFLGALAIQAFPAHYKTPYSEDWNLNLEKGFGQNTVLKVGYMGTEGVHFAVFQDPNRFDPTTHVRAYPDFSGFALYNACCSTSYNALQATFRRQFSHGFSFNVNYTYSHSIDESSVSFGTYTQNDQDLRAERSNADQDVRHLVEFDYIYQIPAIPHVPKLLGDGWQINGITAMRSGIPVNITCGCDPDGVGSTYATGRPDFVAGVSPRPSNYSLPFHEINAAAYVLQPIYPAPGYHFGDVGRNSVYGPSIYNWDFSTFKNFRFAEKFNMEFRAEIFNIFNTPEFSPPVGNILSPFFGQSTSTITTAGGFGSSRQIQFALKFLF